MLFQATNRKQQMQGHRKWLSWPAPSNSPRCLCKCMLPFHLPFPLKSPAFTHSVISVSPSCCVTSSYTYKFLWQSSQMALLLLTQEGSLFLPHSVLPILYIILEPSFSLLLILFNCSCLIVPFLLADKSQIHIPTSCIMLRLIFISLSFGNPIGGFLFYLPFLYLPPPLPSSYPQLSQLSG